MELEYIVMAIVMVIVIFIGLNIVVTIFTGSGVTDLIFNGMSKFVRSIFSGRAYNICDDFNNKELTLEEFQSLLQSMDKEECGSAQVRIRFTVTENDLKRVVGLIGSDKTLLVLEGAVKPLGANAILVYGNPGPRVLKRDDKLELRRAGMPRPDILITLLESGCDPTDDDCDASCTFKSDVCDPMCYQPGVITGEQCDIDCVDGNNDGVPEADGICDPDCYNNAADPNNAYDPDCIRSGDGVCEPDSNGVQDGVCDTDCAGDNLICDPDCDGTGGTPRDRECFECDSGCNNFCSRVCQAGDDPDCMGGFGTKTPCCGNNNCDQDIGENCGACSKDCPGGGVTCAGLLTGSIPAGQDAICCPEGDSSDDYGCGVYSVGLSEGQSCSCSSQCSIGLECQQSTDPAALPGNYCCPSGKLWNGTQCIIPDVFDLVFVPINWGPNDFDSFKSVADTALNHFMTRSPFRECPDPQSKVKVYYIDPKDCQVGSCNDHCTDCISKARQCVINNGLGGVYDRFAAITRASSNGGCAGNIPNDGESTHANWPIANSHELGHTLGLGHLRCGVPARAGPCRPTYVNIADCSDPEEPTGIFIMDYCQPMEKYGPAGYNFMKTEYDNRGGLAKWLDGC